MSNNLGVKMSSNHGESRGRKLNTNDFGTGVVAVDNNLRG